LSRKRFSGATYTPLFIYLFAVSTANARCIFPGKAALLLVVLNRIIRGYIPSGGKYVHFIRRSRICVSISSDLIVIDEISFRFFFLLGRYFPSWSPPCRCSFRCGHFRKPDVWLFWGPALLLCGLGGLGRESSRRGGGASFEPPGRSCGAWEERPLEVGFFVV
jgi:hypothetical protein